VAVATPSSGSRGTTAGALARRTPARTAPASRPANTSGRRQPGLLPGRTVALTRPVSVPVRYVVDTLPSPSWATEADWVPIAQAASARMTNWAPPAGREPVTSQPASTPASSSSSVPSSRGMYGGQCSPGGLSAGSAGHRLAACHPSWVPMATPATYPATAVALCVACDTDARASAKPNSAMFPVITLVNAVPSRVMLVTSDAPDANVRTVTMTVITRADGAPRAPGTVLAAPCGDAALTPDTVRRPVAAPN
jgi:hypothetical protein